MTERIKSKVGSKGELFPPISLRKKLGLIPGQNVFYSIQKGRLIIEPIPDLQNILKSKEPKVKVTLEELKRDRLALSKDAEE